MTFHSPRVELINLTTADKIMLAHGEILDEPHYLPSCRCGWQGPLQYGVMEAREELAKHLQEKHD